MAEGVGRPIGFGQAVAEQARWFWQRMRVWILIVAVLVSVAAAYMIGQVPDDQSEAAILIVAMAFHPLLLLIALSWAFSAWRDDPPKDRQYFWLHAVPRTSHTIARSLAAFAWLFVVVAAIVAVILVATLLTQGADAILGTPRFWAYFLGGIGLAYLVASISPVLSNRPGVWLVAFIALVVIANAIAQIRNLEWLKRVVAVFNDGRYSLTTAMSGPSVEALRVIGGEEWSQRMQDPAMATVMEARPGTALLIWLPIAALLFLAAARVSRPR